MKWKINNNVKKDYIYFLSFLNFATLFAIIILIWTSFFQGDSTPLFIALMILLVVTPFDLFMFWGRKRIFIDVILTEDCVQVIAFKKVLKEIKLSDVKIIYIKYQNMFIMSQDVEYTETGFKNMKPENYIQFVMGKDSAFNIFHFVTIDKCYIYRRTYDFIKEKVKGYIDIEETQF